MRTALLVVPYLFAVTLNAAGVWFACATLCIGDCWEPRYAFGNVWMNVGLSIALVLASAFLFVATFRRMNGMLREGTLSRGALDAIFFPFQVVGCLEIISLGGLGALCFAYGIVAFGTGVLTGVDPGYLEDGGRLWILSAALMVGMLCKLGPSADHANGVGM